MSNVEKALKEGVFFIVVINIAGGVVTDQAEADEDTSMKNRALMAVGK